MRSLENKIANIMGYEYCIFFPRARDAVAAYVTANGKIDVPSNCCPALAQANGVGPIKTINVDPATGLAPNLPVQLYGYRQIVHGVDLEIDPLMTGALGLPFARHCIISFGWNKTIQLGSGGAFLTDDRHYLSEFMFTSWLPPLLIEPLKREIENLHRIIDAKRLMAKYWDQHLGDSLERIPGEQIIAWRTMRIAPNGMTRREIVKGLRAAGFNAGVNYPPLPGVTDPGAIQWGNRVLNLWGAADDVPKACDIIKKVVNDLHNR